jgi:RNA polymerase-binding transcription factor
MGQPEAPIEEGEARELLLRERQRIEASLSDLERVRSSELEEVDTATNPLDHGEVIEEEQVDEALASQLRGELEAVGRGEKRLAEGTYGFSVESGEPIPAERLRTIPWAERTETEQERFERTHGGPLEAAG